MLTIIDVPNRRTIWEFEVGAYGSSAALSPDGNLIMVAREIGETDILLFDTRTGEHLNTFNNRTAQEMHWSPDGRFVVGMKGGYKPGNSLLMTADLSQLVVLSSLGKSAVDAAWSPDSKRIVFVHPDSAQVVEIALLPDSAELVQSAEDIAIIPAPPPVEPVELVAPAPMPTPLPAEAAETPSPFQGTLPFNVVMQLGEGQFNLAVPSPDGARLAAAGSIGVKAYDAETFDLLWLARVGDVAVVEWSPDSSMVAAGLYNGDIYVLDGRTGGIVYEMTSYKTEVTNLEWAPTSDRLLATRKNGVGMIWDFTPPIILNRTDMEGRLSPNGKWYATFFDTGEAWWSNTIAIWDAVTGKQIRLVETDPMINVIWLDDERLMTISDDGTLTTWNAMSGERLSEIEGNPDEDPYYYELEPAPDLDLLAVSAHEATRVHDMATGQRLYNLPYGESQIIWYPDGDQFVSFDRENYAAVWHRAEDGVEIKRIEGVTQMGSISPDWQTLYGWSGPDGNTLSAWDITTGERTSIVTGTPSLYSVSWSPDGNYVAAGVTAPDDQVAEVLVWDVRTATISRTFDMAMGDSFRYDYNQVQVAWSPDGSMLAAGAERVMVWDMQTGDELVNINGIAYSLAWSPDSSQLATSGEDTVTIIDSQTGRRALTFSEHLSETNSPSMDRAMVTALDWSEDGQWIASGGTDHFAMVWDASTGEIIMCSKLPDIGIASLGIPALALSPDAQFLVVGASGDFYPVFDDNGDYHREFTPDAYMVSVASGEVIYQFGSVYSSVGGIDWSPDGTEIAMSFGQAGYLYGIRRWGTGATPILIWDAKTGAHLYTLAGHADNAHGVAFSPDGTRLASASLDGTVLIWTMEE